MFYYYNNIFSYIHRFTLKQSYCKAGKILLRKLDPSLPPVRGPGDSLEKIKD
jgi:hypothetical protein